MLLLSTLPSPPEFLFLENVKPFTSSSVHVAFSDVLISRGYVWTESILSPLQFWIPNNRTRFYISARRMRKDGEGYRNEEIVNEPRDPPPKVEEGVYEKFVPMCCALPISDFILSDEVLLELYGDMFESSLVVSKETLSKDWARGLSIVGLDDCVTFCFTSSYGKVIMFPFNTNIHRLFATHFLPPLSPLSSNRRTTSPAEVYSPVSHVEGKTSNESRTWPQSTKEISGSSRLRSSLGFSVSGRSISIRKV